MKIQIFENRELSGNAWLDTRNVREKDKRGGKRKTKMRGEKEEDRGNSHISNSRIVKTRSTFKRKMIKEEDDDEKEIYEIMKRRTKRIRRRERKREKCNRKKRKEKIGIN